MKADYYTFEITTTQLCNLKCTYCFEDSAEGDIKVKGKKSSVTVETISKKVYELLASEEIKKHYNGHVHIVFWGGEPTLNNRMILDIIEEFGDNENISFMLYSNGFIMKPYRMIQVELMNTKFKMERFHIQISYDGHAIHKLHRMTHGERGTENVVMKAIDEIYGMGFDISLKATMPPENFDLLNMVWDEHYELVKKYAALPGHERATFRYCPTIDYSHGDTDNLDFDEWMRQIKMIAKKELAFYKEHGHYLWTWFDDTEPIRCAYTSFGSTMNANGDMYKCHGEFYHNEKDVNIITTIESDNFIEEVLATADKMQKLNKKDYDKSTPCDTCVATHCQQCNSVKRTFSNKPTFEEQWMDFTNQPTMCKLYKMFGVVARALHSAQRRME